MKRIAVLRHAKSRYDEPPLDDVDRPLSDRGRKAARRMGQEIWARCIHVDTVLASSAVRVRETVDGLEQALSFAVPVQFDEGLYLASSAELMEIVRGLPESVKSPLLIGHNPGLQELLLELSHDDQSGFRTEVAAKFPTAAFAIVELPGERWDKIEPGSGRIVELILPRRLDQ